MFFLKLYTAKEVLHHSVMRHVSEMPEIIAIFALKMGQLFPPLSPMETEFVFVCVMVVWGGTIPFPRPSVRPSV